MEQKKSHWEYVAFNLLNLKAETERAVLIMVPQKAKYGGWCFWHPSKLIKRGSHGYELAFIANHAFKFKLCKYGKRRNVLDTAEVDFKTIQELFNR